jgi:hypothetical protein
VNKIQAAQAYSKQPEQVCSQAMESSATTGTVAIPGQKKAGRETGLMAK